MLESQKLTDFILCLRLFLNHESQYMNLSEQFLTGEVLFPVSY